MATVQSKQFTNESVVVDGNRYEGCTFTGCTLVYQGGALPVFVRCQFPGTTVGLDAAAYQTITYLKGLYQGGLSLSVERVLQGIVSGELPTPDRPLPPPPAHLGKNWGELMTWQGVLVGATALLALFVWYSYFQFPVGQLADNEPIQQEFPIDAMPALPESLARSYDLIRDGQLALLEEYAIVDEATGTVRIPLDEAFAILQAQADETDDNTGEE